MYVGGAGARVCRKFKWQTQSAHRECECIYRLKARARVFGIALFGRLKHLAVIDLCAMGCGVHVIMHTRTCVFDYVCVGWCLYRWICTNTYIGHHIRVEVADTHGENVRGVGLKTRVCDANTMLSLMCVCLCV